jgi:hypothetical protein
MEKGKQIMNYIYKSHAKWSKIDDSYDIHDSEKTANSIASRLLSTYNRFNPCDIRGTCLKTWVTKEIINKE